MSRHRDIDDILKEKNALLANIDAWNELVGDDTTRS